MAGFDIVRVDGVMQCQDCLRADMLFAFGSVGQGRSSFVQAAHALSVLHILAYKRFVHSFLHVIQLHPANLIDRASFP